MEKLRRPFDICPSHATERWMANNPEDIASGNARRKVELSEHFTDSDRVLVGADTIIAGKSGVFGKPIGPDSARRMLESLSNCWHNVITGIFVFGPPSESASDPICVETKAVTLIRFRSLSRTDIRSYLDSQEWVGKAGAYAIQNKAREFVAELDGDFDNVVGLPVKLIDDILLRHFSHCRFL